MSGPTDPQLEDTRGRLLGLLCSANRTTNELARDLKISANGVRWHLERLEEGMVERRTVRGGVGKPAHRYSLREEGSRRLSRAYLPVLSAVLSVLRDRQGTGEQETLMRQVGSMLARQYPTPSGALRERVDLAAGRLEELGAITFVREEEHVLRIHGACCPFRALVPDHPLARKAVESMLEEYIGAPVREQCQKNDQPTCRFLVGAAN